MTKMHRNGWLLVIGNFITDIGNGMFNLALGLLLYAETKSALVFALVLSSEMIIGLLIQVLAGPLVDRGDSRKSMIWIDILRGTGLIVAAASYYLGAGLYGLYVVLIILNIVKPFYKSAGFSLTSTVISAEETVRVISYKGAASQAGQLIGIALAGPLLLYLGAMAVLVIDGASFIGSALMTVFIVIGQAEQTTKVPKSDINLLADWQNALKIIFAKPSAAWIMFLASGDFLFVSLLNIFLVPLNKTIADNAIHLSIMDGSFAVGSLLMGLLADPLISRWGKRFAVLMALSTEVACFVALTFSRNMLIITPILMLFGLSNTLSLSVFMSSLQIRAKGHLKGRISSLRQVIVSVVCGAGLPLMAQLINISGINVASVISASCVGVYLIITLLVTRPSLYGDEFFSERISGEIVAGLT